MSLSYKGLTVTARAILLIETSEKHHYNKVMKLKTEQPPKTLFLR